MTEYNVPPEDEERHHPVDTPVAGSPWYAGHAGERTASAEQDGATTDENTEEITDETGEHDGAATDDLAGEEPMVEHVAEHPVGPYGDDEAEETAVAASDEEPIPAAEGHPVDEPAAEEAPVAAPGTAAPAPLPDRLIDPADAGRFMETWHEVKSAFVDDPPDAVQRAADLSAAVVDELTAALGRLRQDLDDHWRSGDGEPDTERLRVALRGYGTLIDRILTR